MSNKRQKTASDGEWSEVREAALSGRFSDFIIKCGTKEYQAHKVIVCSQVKFFDAACNSLFMEAQSGVVYLPDDDSQAVDDMMKHLYRGKYMSEAELNIDIEATPNEDLITHLHRHANTYMIADKYDIQSLRLESTDVFRSLVESYEARSVPHLLDLADKIFGGTPETDKTLRSMVFKMIAAKSFDSVGDAFYRLIKRHPIIGYWSVVYAGRY